MSAIVILGCGSAKQAPAQQSESHFLDLTCGNWVEAFELVQLHGDQVASGRSKWRCTFNASKGVYETKGTFLESPQGTYGFTRVIKATTAKRADWTYEDELGTESTGFMRQIGSNEFESVSYHSNGNLMMSNTSVVTSNRVMGALIYYDQEGKPYVKGTITATRDDEEATKKE